MNKILIIIRREFLTRVKKKSFLLVTILVPLMMAGFYAFMIWMMLKEDTEKRNIAVINKSNIEQIVNSNEYTKYEYNNDIDFEKSKQEFVEKGYYAVLYLPENLMESNEAELFSLKQIPMDLKSSISSQIRKKIEQIKRDKIIQETGVPDLEKRLAETKTSIYLKTMKLEEGGEAKESSSEVTSVIGIAGGFIIYIFILIYCTQVMRGVIEEKSNRIIEVIISSVKPFQLMMGKIIGIAMVGLLQFLIWIILSGIIVFAVQALLMPDLDMESIRQSGANLSAIAQTSNLDIDQAKILSNIVNTIDSGFIFSYLAAFLFYFIGGYLLYAALFAAIGAAVDNETETQQFMTPLAIILAISLYMGFGVMRSPESSMAVWASIVPFTSPIVMLVRIPFGVPTIQLVSSIVILIVSFFALTWLSGKIYRTGILMYGKKITSVSYTHLRAHET